MTVARPKLTPMVWKVADSAIPVITPGNAIGRISTKEIVSRPKNWKRLTASAAAVPRIRAMVVAPAAATIEVKKAPSTLRLLNASMNQCSEKPDGGHTCDRVGLKA